MRDQQPYTHPVIHDDAITAALLLFNHRCYHTLHISASVVTFSFTCFVIHLILKLNVNLTPIFQLIPFITDLHTIATTVPEREPPLAQIREKRSQSFGSRCICHTRKTFLLSKFFWLSKDPNLKLLTLNMTTIPLELQSIARGNHIYQHVKVVNSDHY